MGQQSTLTIHLPMHRGSPVTGIYLVHCLWHLLLGFFFSLPFQGNLSTGLQLGPDKEDGEDRDQLSRAAMCHGVWGLCFLSPQLEPAVEGFSRF